MKIKIPTIEKKVFHLDLKPNGVSIFIGANGSGKTRLSVYIEEEVPKMYSTIKQLQRELSNLTTESEKIHKISEDAIKNKFDEYNQQKWSIENEKLNCYQFVSFLLENKMIADFNSCNFKLNSFPPQSLTQIHGGKLTVVIQSQKYTWDVDLLKFSKKYKENGTQVINQYRDHLIKNIKSKITNKQDEINKIDDNYFKKAYRVAAHRGLTFNDNFNYKNSNEAKANLENVSGKFTDNNKITGLQNDFSQLLVALYSEEAENTSDFTRKIRDGMQDISAPKTALSILIKVWNELLNNRTLKLEKLKLHVISNASTLYSPSEMSDGERNMFYILGQCLLADPKTLLIIDEPELHINKSISEKFWRKIQSLRKDCGFLFITHDVDFIQSQNNANKYHIQQYQHCNKWDVKNIEVQDTSRELENAKIRILGSRKNILFVEGRTGSLDLFLFSRIYEEYLVIPVGSCELVKKSVRAFNNNPLFHHLKLYGIIDRDNLNDKNITKLNKDYIFPIKTATLENMFLIPEIAKKIIEFKDSNFKESNFVNSIFSFIKKQDNKNGYVLNEAKHRIEKCFKSQLNRAKSIKDLNISIENPKEMVSNELDEIIKNNDLMLALKKYRNKGLYKKIFSDYLNAKDVDREIKHLVENNNEILDLFKKHCPKIDL